MAVMEQATTERPRAGRWQSIDWAMRGISLASKLCADAGLHDVAEELATIHEAVRRRRDRA